MTIILLFIFLILPAVLIYVSHRIHFLGKIGPVILCYVVGVLLANTGLIPADFAGIQETITEVSVALALPLLLFSVDVLASFRLAGKAMFSLFFAILSVSTISFLLFLSMRNHTAEAYQLAGMAMGVYSGGTPNLAAIRTALDISSNTYVLFHTYDTVIGFVYIMFLVLPAKFVFLRYLKMKPFKALHPDANAKGEYLSESFETLPVEQSGLVKDEKGVHVQERPDIESYQGMFRLHILAGMLIAVILSGLIVGLSVFISDFFKAGPAIIILLITTFGMAASFLRPVRNIQYSFQAGMYIIYIFCIAVASMTDLESLMVINWPVLTFITVAVFGSLMLHALFCRIFGVDVDTFLVTSVSAICSPPFVPVVVGVLKNRAVLLAGLSTGILGYAIGNYLGITMALLFQSLP